VRGAFCGKVVDAAPFPLAQPSHLDDPLSPLEPVGLAHLPAYNLDNDLPMMP
jgi:hypothetical protein